jgi:SAM-dependent methyltransferase
MDEINKDVYEKIAKRFSETRSGYYWNEITDYIKSLPAHSLIADAGCGNGRYMNLNSKFGLHHQFIGFDFCDESTKICNKRGFDICVGDTRTIPYRSNVFDSTISIAVIHHLDSDIKRINACKEISRITKKGGTVFIQVWASDVKKTKKFIPINDNNDYYVTWYIDKDTRVKRYYHLFERDEFVNIVTQSGITILKCIYDHENWIIVGQC